MKKKKINYYETISSDFKHTCKKCSSPATILNFRISLKLGICMECRKKLLPCYIPKIQSDKYWEYKYDHS